MGGMRAIMPILLGAALLLAGSIGAKAQVYYTINGYPAPQATARVMAQNGLPPGAYWYDQRTGNWGVVGNRRPLGNIPTGRSWNSWSGAAGMGVGGTGNGCIYTTVGWSNC